MKWKVLKKVNKKFLLISGVSFLAIALIGVSIYRFGPMFKADIVTTTQSANIVFDGDTSKYTYDATKLAMTADSISLDNKPAIGGQQLIPFEKYMGRIWQAVGADNFVTAVTDGSTDTYINSYGGQVWFSLIHPNVADDAKNIRVRAELTSLNPMVPNSLLQVGVNNCVSSEGTCSSTNLLSGSNYYFNGAYNPITPAFLNDSNNNFYAGINLTDTGIENPQIAEIKVFLEWDSPISSYPASGSIELASGNLVDSTTPATKWSGVQASGVSPSHQIPEGSSAELKICAGEDRNNLSSCASKNITAIADLAKEVIFATPAVGRYARFSLTLFSSTAKDKAPVLPKNYLLKLVPEAAAFLSFSPQVAPAQTEITISGKNLGTVKQDIKFVETQEKYISDEQPTSIANPPAFVTVPASAVVSWTDTAVKVKVPSGLGQNIGYALVSKVATREASLGLFWLSETTSTCVSKLISVNKSYLKVGDEITVFGTSLGSQATSIVSFYSAGNDPLVAEITAFSSTSFTVKVPNGIFRARPVAYYIKLTDRNGCVSTIGPLIVDPSAITACTMRVTAVYPFDYQAQKIKVLDSGNIRIVGSGFGTKASVKLGSVPTAANADLSTATVWGVLDASGNQTIETRIPEGLSPSYLYTLKYTNTDGCTFDIGPFIINAKIWTGNGTTNNWSEGKNWSDNTAPSVSIASPDNVYFLGTSGGLYSNGNKNCTVDIPGVARRLDIRAYTGTIDLGPNEMWNSKLVFNAASATIDATNGRYTTQDFILTNGTFKSPKGTCSGGVEGNCLYLYSTTSAATYQINSTAQFIHNDGEVVVSSEFDHKRAIKISTNTNNTANPSNAFYNLALAKPAKSSMASALDLSGSTILVANNLTVGNYVSDFNKKFTINNIVADTGNLGFLGSMPVVFGDSSSKVTLHGDFSNKIGLANLSFLSALEVVDNTRTSKILDTTYFEGDFSSTTPKKVIQFETMKVQFMKKSLIIAPTSVASEADYITLQSTTPGVCHAEEELCKLPTTECLLGDDPACYLSCCNKWIVAATGTNKIVNAKISESYNIGWIDANANDVIDNNEDYLVAENSIDNCNNYNWNILENSTVGTVSGVSTMSEGPVENLWVTVKENILKVYDNLGNVLR
jgi:hypothetical protein